MVISRTVDVRFPADLDSRGRLGVEAWYLVPNWCQMGDAAKCPKFGEGGHITTLYFG